MISFLLCVLAVSLAGNLTAIVMFFSVSRTIGSNTEHALTAMFGPVLANKAVIFDAKGIASIGWASAARREPELESALADLLRSVAKQVETGAHRRQQDTMPDPPTEAA